jgi:hypothetical protein
MRDPAEVLQWGEWRPLADAGRDPTIPAEPGISRIRRVGHEDLDFVGHSGKGEANIRSRLGHLRNIYKEVKPSRAPHTAAPGLWELRQQTGEEFEVSVAPVMGSTSWRKGLVALVIARYRQEHHRSPTVQFGRMPIEYQPASSDSQQLMEAAGTYRGERTWQDASATPSIPPAGPFDGEPGAIDWGGHEWSPWIPLEDITEHRLKGSGLYRIRGHQLRHLAAIGHGNVKQRINSFRQPAVSRTAPRVEILGNPALLECSWVVNDSWDHHQRLELVNDLEAAHFLVTGEMPNARTHD